MVEEELDNEEVLHDGTVLPAGAQVWLPTFLPHRSHALWGPDADSFNPEREFTEDELFFSGRVPYSPRYCPFTHPPRSCIGLNFAQMEARVILIHLLHAYSFTLAEPTLSMVQSEQDFGYNKGTMGVRGGLYCQLSPRNTAASKL